MLRQPRSPRPEARGVDTGGPQLLGNQGAIGGEAAGKDKADLRGTMRLGGSPGRRSLSKLQFSGPQLPWNQGPQPLHPGEWHRKSSQHVHPPVCLQHCSPHRHTLVTLGMAPMAICLHGAEDAHALCCQSRVWFWGSPRCSPLPWEAHAAMCSSHFPACLLQPGETVGRRESWDPHEQSSIGQVR